MSRKDDPVFNVKFVQAVERNQCLWNSTLPAYSKKEEIQKAWQDVANETKDTVRSCRERWRTIRSSFLRSLKMSRTSTGRGKRKYYLSKYLQFLIPYTKTRLKHHTPSSMMALRKYSSTIHLSGLADAPRTPSQTPLPTPPPMTCINHMPLPIVSSDDTKDSNSSDVAAIAEEDVVVSFVDPEIQHRQQQQQQHEQQQLQEEEEEHQQQQMLLYTNHNNNINNNNNNNNNISNQNNNNNHLKINNNNNNSCSKNSNGFYNQNFQNATLALQQQLQQHIQQQHQPMRLPAIKCEPGTTSPPLNYSQNSAVDKHQSACGNNNNNNSINSNNNNNNTNNNSNYATTVGENSNRRATISSSTATATVDLGEFADWIKNRNALSQQQQQQLQRQYASTPASPPDADQSFLNSLHPYLKEMSGKQNRRFRQKVVALVDAILDNAD